MTQYIPSDIFGNVQLETNFTEQLDGLHFRTFKLLEKHPYYGRAIPWELTITDLRGGYSQAGELTNDYAKTASSTLDYRDQHNLTVQLAATINTDTTIDSSVPIASLPIFSVLALGAGATANLSLYSGSLTAANARTYSPGSNITCLHPIVIGGATSAVRLLVGRAGASPQVLADLGSTPTVSGTMHANLNPTWGMLTSYLNASNPSTGTHLFYANGSIYTLPITAAIGDAPTVAGTASVYPNGGWAVDIIKWGGVDRAVWYMPQANRTTSVVLNPVGLTARGTVGKIIHTNLEGTDPQELKVKGLRDIVIAFAWRKGLFLSDELSAYYVGDDEIRNLGFSRNWPLTAGNTRNTIYGAWPHGNDLIVLYKRWLTTQSATASFGTELYNWKLNTWQRTQGPTEATGVAAASGIGAMPFTPGTEGTLHYTTISGAFTYQNVTQSVPRGGQSVFSLRTVGAEVGLNFETTGVWTSPLWTLPGLGGYPSVITEIDCTQVDLASGGSGTTIKVEVTAQPGTSQSFTGTIKPAEFDTNTPIDERIKTYDDNIDDFNAFQVRITLTPGASYKTGNALPITIRGITYTDRNVVPPKEVRGKGWSR